MEKSLKAKILPATPSAIQEAVQLLRAHELVAIPTETVYGLAGLAFDEESVAKIFAAKERPRFDPLIVHVASADLEALDQQGITDTKKLSPQALRVAKSLIQAFWPGPLTLVLPRGPKIPDLVTSGLDTVAVRMPSHPVALQLIQTLGQPLAAPSANRFGKISPTSAEHVFQELGDRIPLILVPEQGPKHSSACQVGIESTILSIGAELTLLRPGGIGVPEIEKATGVLVRRSLTLGVQSVGLQQTGLASPGLLPSHYAPNKRLLLLPKSFAELTDADLNHWWQECKTDFSTYKHLGLLVLLTPPDLAIQRMKRLTGLTLSCRTLSPQGDRSEAARNLFSELRLLDASDAQLLVAESCTDATGLGYAIQDRLTRAAGPRN